MWSRCGRSSISGRRSLCTRSGGRSRRYALSRLGSGAHLARYQLVSTPTTIVVKTPAGQLLDLEHKPGTVLEEILMADVLEPFETQEGTAVPAMRAPRPHLVIDPHLLGGYPVIAGSRVPFDLVAGLADEGREARRDSPDVPFSKQAGNPGRSRVR